MSTSDQQGGRPLTRKQLREIRLTGATPVIGEEEAAAAKNARPALVASPPRPTEPPERAPITEVGPEDVPLTRRQARAQERLRTASIPVAEPVESPVDEVVSEPEQSDETPAAPGAPEEVESVENATAGETPDVVDEPVDAADSADSEESASEDSVDDEAPAEDHPVVSPTFGTQVLGDGTNVPAFAPSFDELIGSESGGSHHAQNTLIFTHPGEASLSGPVTSTGEVLVTGSYELPSGIGSQGHAAGVADGKEVDAVLIDGELPASSSPTPIAASAAVSTSKPAGEVIRPPAPEKGNKLMLMLSITAGALALLVAAALVVAFTTNVFG